jgi:IclR family transcriptional regulator, acetate operon repressor
VNAEPVARAEAGRSTAPDSASRYTVGSVARALRLLDVIATGPAEGLTVSELARELGTSKSTAFALAHTLVEQGYLRGVEPGPRYLLGLALVRLGDVSANRLPIGPLCRPILHALTARTGLTTRAALNDGSQPLFVERVDAPGAIRFHTPLGVPELAHVSSAGKAILAQLSDEAVRELIAGTELVRRTPKTIVEPGELLADLAATRRRGYAVDDEEDVEGVFCIGAPFFDYTGACVGAISATGIKRDLPPRAVEELGQAVRAAADEVTMLLRGSSARTASIR